MFIYEDMARAIKAIFETPPDPVTGLKDTETLLRFVLHLQNLATVYAGLFKFERRLNAMADWVQKLWIRAGKANAPLALKRRMLLDLDWKARVFRELGGERAFEQWDRLWQGYQSRLLDNPPGDMPPQSTSHDIEAAPKSPRKIQVYNPLSRIPYTDAKGEFRLAPVPRPNIKPAPPLPHSRIGAAPRVIPIHLTPSDFREPLPRASEAAIAESLQRRARANATHPRDFEYQLPKDIRRYDEIRALVWKTARGSPYFLGPDICQSLARA